MPNLYTMEEFDALPPEKIWDLLPNDFDGPTYCRQFGTVEYQRFNHMVNITNKALVKLTDGSHLKFHLSYNEYIPIWKSDRN